MFSQGEALNPNNESYSVKTIEYMLSCVIHDSTTTVITSIVYIGLSTPAPSFLQSSIT